MGIWAIVIGLILIALGGFELFSVVRAYNTTKTSGNKSTSPFIAYGLWTGIVIAFFLAVAGIVTMTQFY